jgi:arylsulfatase A-like enzyme
VAQLGGGQLTVQESLMHLKSLIVLLMLVCMMASAPAEAQPARSRPNILFVFIDDMGYGDLSCFGGTRVQTQAIDRLASEGIRFEQFYVNSPICSPSRVAVTTGQYPNRWRITSFLNTRKDDLQRGMADGLAPEAPSLARFLAREGYHTAHVGKWHMGGQRDVNDAPLITEYGFKAFVTNFEGLGARILPRFESLAHGPTMMSAEHGGPGAQWEERHRVTERFVDRAIQEIDVARENGQPFYINLWPDDVHTPCEPPPELRGDGSPDALYRGVLLELDRQLGRVFEHIRADVKLRENTLILLASDNGHESGFGSGGGLRGSKATLYEGGIRSPLVVWGPGIVKKSAAHNDTTVLAGMDLPPSLLRVVGVAPPKDVAFDGLDMSAVLVGDSDERRPSPVMWMRPPDRPGPAKNPLPDLAIRDGDWKLLVNRDASGAQLYDISRDSSETNNLAARHPQRVQRLLDAVIAWDRAIAQQVAAGREAAGLMPKP